MANKEHGLLLPLDNPTGNRGNHSIEGFLSVVDEAARNAIVQVVSDRGRAVYQTAGIVPGWYLALGVTGSWSRITNPSASIETFPQTLNEASRSAIVQVLTDRGRVIYQTGGLVPGWYIAFGVTGFWQLISGSGIKEVWFEHQDSLGNFGTSMRSHTNASSGALRFMLRVPPDFLSLVSCDALVQPSATNAAADIDLTSQHGVIGGSALANTQTNNANLYAFVANVLTTVALSSVLSTIVANSLVGILVTTNAVGGNQEWFGVRFRYNPI